MFDENIDLGYNINKRFVDESCSVLEMKNATGRGQMTSYEIMPGICIMYNDFHMEYCTSKALSRGNMICIDHCREGRIQWDMKNDKYVYIQGGDLRIDCRKKHGGYFEFPLSHYHGLTIGFMIDQAQNSISQYIKEFPVDLEKLREMFCSDSEVVVLRANESISHIFSELYDVPEKIQNTYFKIKVLELLLYLSALNLEEEQSIRPYFTKFQVEKIKAIEKYMTKNIEQRYTLEELSEKFHISLTSMKNCFKGVYGNSIYAYMKSYRMNKAAVLLKETNLSVIDISGKLGYESPSKFSSAFKSIMGKTPTKYRG